MGLWSCWARFTLGSLVVLLVAGCNRPPTTPTVTTAATGTFITKLAGSEEVLVIVVSAPESDGARTVKAYLCDGEPEGDAEWFGGSITASEATYTSKNNVQSSLLLRFEPAQVTGEVRLAGGARFAFVATAAAPGEGVYSITVNPNGTYDGISVAGDTLRAGTVAGGALECDHNAIRGTVNTATGQVLVFGAHNMTTCTAAELTGRGHTPVFATSGRAGSVPDIYAAVVQRLGIDWVVYGRATTFPVRQQIIPPSARFVAGGNFIGLNMDDAFIR